MRTVLRWLTFLIMAITILLATIRLAHHVLEISRIPLVAIPDRILPLAKDLALIGLNVSLI